MSIDMIRVSYYTCNCEWTSKYCDEYHKGSVLIPADVIAQYRSKYAE